MKPHVAYDVYCDTLNIGSWFYRTTWSTKRSAVKEAKRISKEHNRCPVRVTRIMTVEVFRKSRP